MKSLKIFLGLIAALLLVSCEVKKEIPDAEITAIAKEAYIYGYPMVKNYKDMYASAINVQGPDYKKPFNEFYMSTKIDTPADTDKETARNDTPYGYVWMDLRREPLVMTVPAVEDNRYYSVQFTDLYAYNFEYVGTRTTGNAGGKFLVAGPDWKGDIPQGIDRIIRSDSQFVHGLVRIQLLNAEDLPNVQKIQEGFLLEPLSKYTGTTAPAEADVIAFPAYKDEAILTPAFFSYMNFMMQFVVTPQDETELMNRFGKIAVGAGKSFSMEGMPENEKKAYQAGIDSAITDLDGVLKGDLIKGADMHGTREELKNNYVNRAFGAMTDLFGASPKEILSITYKLDSGFKVLNGAAHYAIRFEKDQLPPANSFWSLTLYDLPAQRLVANPINRYHVNSMMVSQMTTDPVDGSVTVFIQKNMPGAEQLIMPAEPAVKPENLPVAKAVSEKAASKQNAASKAEEVKKPNAKVKADAPSREKMAPKVNIAPKIDIAPKLGIAEKISDRKAKLSAAAKAKAKTEVSAKPLAEGNQPVVAAPAKKDVPAKKDQAAADKEKVKPAVASDSTVALAPEKQPEGTLSANWLPAPDGDFYMVLRIYNPKEEALNGTWKEPVVMRLNMDGTPVQEDKTSVSDQPVDTAKIANEQGQPDTPQKSAVDNAVKPTVPADNTAPAGGQGAANATATPAPLQSAAPAVSQSAPQTVTQPSAPSPVPSQSAVQPAAPPQVAPPPAVQPPTAPQPAQAKQTPSSAPVSAPPPALAQPVKKP